MTAATLAPVDLPGFDHAAVIAALDAQRVARGLDWHTLAVVLHAQSAELNAELDGPCMCSGALWRTARQDAMSCQYAMSLLRWLGRPPEDFLTGESMCIGETAMPDPGPAYRLRWDLPQLHAALDGRRRTRQLSWTHLGGELGATPSRLTNYRTTRLADLALTMRITQWLEQPAATFIHPARW